ncbi:hypothetical protein [Hyalangium gracile]|uniref:hypothetical protein n=1 Tax=Hyalangium gracile TaxID=394092 RepID=UPI001CCA5BE7|nr:hypothetical protein [Hyalangium gracile]
MTPGFARAARTLLRSNNPTLASMTIAASSSTMVMTTATDAAMADHHHHTRLKRAPAHCTTK